MNEVWIAEQDDGWEEKGVWHLKDIFATRELAMDWLVKLHAKWEPVGSIEEQDNVAFFRNGGGLECRVHRWVVRTTPATVYP